MTTPRDKSSLYIKVGLFVSITIVIFFIGIFVVTGDHKFFEKEYYIRTHFENTSGLLPGAYVRLSGVKIGTVDAIDFPNSTEENFIEVTLKVNEQGARRITPDSKATIQTEGLLGANYIEVVRGELPSFTDIDKEMVIESHTPTELQELIGSSDQLLTNLIKISENLDKVSGTLSDKSNMDKFSQTLDSVKKSTDNLRKTLDAIEKGGVLHKLIYDEKLAQDLTTTMADISKTSNNLKDISKSLKDGEGTLGALLIDPSIHDRLKGVLGEAERSRFIRAGVRYLIEKRKNGTEDKP